MRISTITTSGLKITFNTNNRPLTSGLKNLIAGKTVVKPAETTSSPLIVTKKIALAHGEPSPQCSCKKRFVSPLSWDEQDCHLAPRRNCGRKPKGKKPSRATIRSTFLFN